MTRLVRNALRETLRETRSAHPGLLIQRGWTDFVQTNAENGGENGKAQHLARIAGLPTPPIYTHAYQRWESRTSKHKECRGFKLKIDGRLLIGLSSGGALETGCAVSHTHGMPYLPGSSVKGVVRAYAQTMLKDSPQVVSELFGLRTDPGDSEMLSGLMTFHDAWWVPDSSSNKKPFVLDIVTTHHPEYYGNEGNTPASDLDSPVPNNLIGVHGEFYFVIQGPENLLDITEKLLHEALISRGVGAKTRAGYGYFIDENQTMDGMTSTETGFIEVMLRHMPNTGEITADFTDQDGTAKRATCSKEKAAELKKKIPDLSKNQKDKLKKQGIPYQAKVSIVGNRCELLDIRAPIQK